MQGRVRRSMSPIDVVMVLDRTGSMTAGDIANVKNAALSVLDFYEPAEQWVGMVSLPYGCSPANKCIAYGDAGRLHPRIRSIPTRRYTVWQAAPG